jgi:hypothetical protein
LFLFLRPLVCGDISDDTDKVKKVAVGVHHPGAPGNDPAPLTGSMAGTIFTITARLMTGHTGARCFLLENMPVLRVDQ